MIYLSDSWLEALGVALSAADLSTRAPTAKSLPAGPAGNDPLVSTVFAYEISELPENHPNAGAPVRYGIAVSSIGAELSNAQSHIRFSMTYAVACEIASGQRNGGRAFLDGDIRIGGDVSLLISRAADLQAIGSITPPTEYLGFVGSDA